MLFCWSICHELTHFALDICSHTQNDGDVCLKNAHCTGNFCKGSDGLGKEGKCLGPYGDGEDCSEGNGDDRQCLSNRCGLEAAGSNKYVCCSEDTVEHGLIEYCTNMEDGLLCWEDKMCASGYCGGNEGGLRKGVCLKRGSIEDRGACRNGDDDMCVGGLACALDKAGGDYICCSSYGA